LIANLSPEAILHALEESDDAECIRSPKSLMKHALARSGSRDVSAQLFTALCRALGIPARLVVSLQSVPWRTGVGKPKPKTNRKSKEQLENGKGKERDSGNNDEDSDETGEIAILPRDLKGKGKAKEELFPGAGQSIDGRAVKPLKSNTPPVIKLRKSKSKGRTLGSSPTPRRQGKYPTIIPSPNTR
jgi:xeroderma pigmentosum group C-complementing protein